MLIIFNEGLGQGTSPRHMTGFVGPRRWMISGHTVYTPCLTFWYHFAAVQRCVVGSIGLTYSFLVTLRTDGPNLSIVFH